VASLLSLAAPFLQRDTECLFLKGERLDDELTQAAKDWKMTAEKVPSRTDPNGFILRLKEVHRG
jgi:16S rRNA (guanine527-N7)-methyltransferase